MKVTKDNVMGQSTNAYMANLMTAVKPFNPTHIAISTPYDDPGAYPTTAPVAGYALRWATAIRAAGRGIFWRQMPLEWEGIYSKPKNTSRGIGTAAGVLNGSETTTYLGLHSGQRRPVLGRGHHLSDPRTGERRHLRRHRRRARQDQPPGADRRRLLWHLGLYRLR